MIIILLLTHYQTTNFRMFQTERVCRRQFQISRKLNKVIQTGRKHFRKRRNCSLRAISPFPTVFSQGHQKVSLCGNGLKVENNVGKGENADDQHFLHFSQCFQNHLMKLKGFTFCSFETFLSYTASFSLRDVFSSVKTSTIWVA